MAMGSHGIAKQGSNMIIHTFMKAYSAEGVEYWIGANQQVGRTINRIWNHISFFYPLIPRDLDSIVIQKNYATEVLQPADPPKSVLFMVWSI